MKLNIGCGNDIREGWINLDRYPINDKVTYFEINIFPYEWKDGSIDEIYCSHVLEHTNKVDVIIHEFTRILKPGGILHIKLPVFSNGWKHRGWYHVKTYFHSLYGANWKAKTTDSHESSIYSNCNYDLIFFKKNLKFKGINYIYWLIGSMINRFVSWIYSIFFNEYEWKLKKK